MYAMLLSWASTSDVHDLWVSLSCSSKLACSRLVSRSTLRLVGLAWPLFLTPRP